LNIKHEKHTNNSITHSRVANSDCFRFRYWAFVRHNNDIRRTVVSEVTSYFPLQSRQLTMGAITIPW